jgi:hypothetical protein
MVASAHTMILEEVDLEIVRCRVNASYFAWNYVKVLDEKNGEKIPFHLWPAQHEVILGLVGNRLVCLLKGRQIGMTTLVLAYVIWFALFKKPGSTILLFSKGQKEAKELIDRIRWMILALPVWLQPKGFTKDSTEELALTNGSRFISFASRSSGGDGFTASICLVDEADLIPDLNRLLTGAKPTISAGGQLILLSRVDKAVPESPFKSIYRAAVKGESGFWAKFLPWWSAPWRDRKWYEAERQEIVARTGSEDELWENHPESPEQALAPRQLDKRFPLPWLEECFEWLPILEQGELPVGSPALGVAGLRVFKLPERGKKYVIGVDPAQGNPNSDNSVSIVLEWDGLEEVAVLSGKFEPAVLTAYTAELATWFNGAAVMVERNNHGFTVLHEFQQAFPRVVLLRGQDGKPGWLTTSRSKTAMFNAVAEAAQNRAFLIHDRDTFKEISDLEASTLSAPAGLQDDRAIAFSLAVVAVEAPEKRASLTVFSGEPDSSEPEVRRITSGDALGVRWFEAWGCWVAEPVVDGRVEYLGEFPSEEDATTAARDFLRQQGINTYGESS